MQSPAVDLYHAGRAYTFRSNVLPALKGMTAAGKLGFFEPLAWAVSDMIAANAADKNAANPEKKLLKRRLNMVFCPASGNRDNDAMGAILGASLGAGTGLSMSASRWCSGVFHESSGWLVASQHLKRSLHLS